jgi:hypothetical protein
MRNAHEILDVSEYCRIILKWMQMYIFTVSTRNVQESKIFIYVVLICTNLICSEY